ncbi:MAG TPA: glycosyltransferase, partial [Solirubrobacteraceae bacterium]|nr:glycosyltransferase [Solirubrobacteraceae bacterium]
ARPARGGSFQTLPSQLVHALVLSNMRSDEHRPERGSFVRDQVAALRTLPGIDVELCEFAPGARTLLRTSLELGGRYRGRRFDVVHAHFGLTAWPALRVSARARGLTVHGTDLSHPRTRLLTAAALARMDFLAAVSPALAQRLPSRRARARALVLPCGVDVGRFTPMPPARARAELSRDGVDLEGTAPLLLFPADPRRAEKRHDRAAALARACGARLLTLGGVAPARVPLYVNAANAVLVPSEREGFGLAALEALACDVPILATPVGIHPEALAGVAGTLCAEFELGRWRAALAPYLHESAPRIAGRARAETFSTRAMAERVADAWRAAIADAG